EQALRALALARDQALEEHTGFLGPDEEARAAARARQLRRAERHLEPGGRDPQHARGHVALQGLELQRELERVVDQRRLELQAQAALRVELVPARDRRAGLQGVAQVVEAPVARLPGAARALGEIEVE